MARPKLPESAKGKPFKVYLRNALRTKSARHASNKGISLSQLINELLRREIERADRKAKAA